MNPFISLTSTGDESLQVNFNNIIYFVQNLKGTSVVFYDHKTLTVKDDAQAILTKIENANK